MTESVKVREAIFYGTRKARLKTLFGLLDIDACDSITCHEAALAFQKIGKIVCDNFDLLGEQIEGLDQMDGRMDFADFSNYLFALILACCPSAPPAFLIFSGFTTVTSSIDWSPNAGI